MERFSSPEQPSLPEKNELPFRIGSSKKLAEGAESAVWEAEVRGSGNLDKMVALKQIRKEEFADEAEMLKSRKFYEFLKSFPKFGQFIPDTLYFKARVEAGDKPQAFCVQRFMDGERIDRIKDEELYKDPEVVKELAEFVDASMDILENVKKNKAFMPDFKWTPEAAALRARLGAVLSDPRYSSNILISKEPGRNGQRVFFVDTGVNLAERSSKLMELQGRYIAEPLHRLHFARWKAKLGKVRKELEKKNSPGR